MEAVTPLSDSCNKGSQSRKEASLSELFRQRSKSVESRRRISFRNLATMEIGPDKKHLLQNSCDSGATRSRQEASLAELLRQRSNSVQKRSTISFKTLATREVSAEKKMKYLSL
jgi:hypothetical protein